MRWSGPAKPVSSVRVLKPIIEKDDGDVIIPIFVVGYGQDFVKLDGNRIRYSEKNLSHLLVMEQMLSYICIIVANLINLGDILWMQNLFQIISHITQYLLLSLYHYKNNCKRTLIL